jgi:hypothetical protein
MNAENNKMQQNPSFVQKLWLMMLSIGPGIFCIGYTIGTGSVTSMAKAGSQFGMQLLWVLVLSCLFAWVLMEAFGRYAIVTGQTAIYSFKTKFKAGRLLAVLVVAGIVIAQWNSLSGIFLSLLILSCSTDNRESSANQDTSASPENKQLSIDVQSIDYDIEERLEELNIHLVIPNPPTANYLKSRRTGNLIYLSDHGPDKPESGQVTGMLGSDLTVEEGKEAARLVGISLLSSLKAEIGGLIATIFNQPSHGAIEGNAEVWASQDGLFWEKRGVPVENEPQTNRMNVADKALASASAFAEKVRKHNSLIALIEL